MPRARHYCADCDTHFGGPTGATVKEHADDVHDGMFRGVKDGDFKDWERRQKYRKS